jgi:CAAX prenyl protease-like protein
LISRQALAYTSPFVCYVLFLMIRSLPGPEVGFDVRWLYGVQVASVSVLLLMFRKEYADLRAPSLTIVNGLWSLACGAAVFAIWINLNQPWAKLGEMTGYSALHPKGGIDPLLAGVRLAGAALVVPVMEELFWRSFLLRWMVDRDFARVDPRRVAWPPLLMVSLVFGVEHDLWLAGLLAGLAYGLLYMRTASLHAPILAHAVTNGMLGAWVLAYGRWEYW